MAATILQNEDVEFKAVVKLAEVLSEGIGYRTTKYALVQMSHTLRAEIRVALEQGNGS